MGNFNIDELPIGSVEEILEAVKNHRVPKWFMECVEFDMAGKDGTWSFQTYLDNQSVLPPIVKDMYTKDDAGLYVFPAKRKNAPLFHGNIGDQTSMYHKETVKQHLLLTCGRLWLNSNPDEIEDGLLCGILHDAGKKYTLGSNQRGEVCFYGHEKVSALFAAVVLNRLGFINIIDDCVRVIYDHMRPFMWENNKEAMSDYIDMYGFYVTHLVMEINAVDKGITDQIIVDNLERLYDIEAGTSIEIEDESTKKAYIELHIGKMCARDLDRSIFKDRK